MVVDLCGGTGTTAEAILALAPADATVISLDSSAAMRRIGCHVLTDPRLTWVNSAAWKTDVAAVVTAVRRILRPGGRFVFNIGGAFAGVTHPDSLVPCSARRPFRRRACGGEVSRCPQHLR
ncbi:class I SAM-dependent methyltransferase [Streptomyces sp. AB3(2024)]|uniref:class I SAM-dependent methyltransferase n=1 Tax=Streptomyces sp. AB3(2024) TaxID=3317321 RepID=UPI0035A2F298